MVKKNIKADKRKLNGKDLKKVKGGNVLETLKKGNATGAKAIPSSQLCGCAGGKRDVYY